jgi:hypothetical protein
MYDFKPAKVTRSLTPGELFIPNQRAHIRILEGAPKLFQFGPFAFYNQFHTSIGQISDGACDFKSKGHALRGVSEPYTLHASGIKDLHAASVHTLWRHPCGSVAVW